MAEPPADYDASSGAPSSPGSKTWAAPTAFILAIAIPVLILIFSNTDSTDLNFAWFHTQAPSWLILAITFIAGALVTRLFGWAWRSMRRRRQA
ncbi:MAG: LapA family protein [Actinobacteria bacterium]|nr:LapA family protein [Actinomycetota bacterium]MBU1866544.1 LapA family protein [Actinomycetota bacterium]